MPLMKCQRSSERLAESCGRRRRQPRGHEGSRVGPRRLYAAGGRGAMGEEEEELGGSR